MLISINAARGGAGTVRNSQHVAQDGEQGEVTLLKTWPRIEAGGQQDPCAPCSRAAGVALRSSRAPGSNSAGLCPAGGAREKWPMQEEVQRALSWGIAYDTVSLISTSESRR